VRAEATSNVYAPLAYPALVVYLNRGQRLKGAWPDSPPRAFLLPLRGENHAGRIPHRADCGTPMKAHLVTSALALFAPHQPSHRPNTQARSRGKLKSLAINGILSAPPRVGTWRG